MVGESNNNSLIQKDGFTYETFEHLCDELNRDSMEDWGPRNGWMTEEQWEEKALKAGWTKPDPTRILGDE